ncbi:hypothetical protein BCM45_10025 [Lactobacillus helveticus]|nr:hypothetical protein BCM45_10025 [Lactobacillus helveticus]
MTERKFNKKIKKLGFQEVVRKVDSKATRVWLNMMLLPEGVENDTDSKIGLKKLTIKEAPKRGFFCLVTKKLQFFVTKCLLIYQRFKQGYKVTVFVTFFATSAL